MDNLYLG